MKKPVSVFFIFFFLVLATLVAAADPVTLQVNKALIYANPGQSFTLSFTIQNPYASTGPSTIDQFDLYVKDVSQSHVRVMGHAPLDWNYGRIAQYDDDHFSKNAFSEGTIQVTFLVDENAPAGKYPLYGYFNYYGEPVDFSPNPLGEKIGPVNDENYQFATLVVTSELVNPITQTPLSGSDTILIGAIIILLIAAGIFWWSQQSTPIAKKKTARH